MPKAINKLEDISTNVTLDDVKTLIGDDPARNIKYTNFDLELIRDIITISRIYDRNILRMMLAREMGCKTKNELFRKVEKHLHLSSELLRTLSGLSLR